LHLFEVVEQQNDRREPPTADEVREMIALYRSHVVDIDSRDLRRLLLLTAAMLDLVNERIASATLEEDRIYQSLRDAAETLSQELEGWKE
jgi:hypothetical protein